MELRFDRTVQQVADLVVEATAERIQEYADGLTGRFPASTRPEIALAIVDKLTADPLDNVLDELAEHGISAERIGRVIDLAKRVPNPLLGALWALAACEKAAPLAVRCASADKSSPTCSGAYQTSWSSSRRSPTPVGLVVMSTRPGADRAPTSALTTSSTVTGARRPPASATHCQPSPQSF